MPRPPKRTSQNAVPDAKHASGRSKTNVHQEMTDFLREYKERPVLWDSRLPNYSKQSDRQDALQQISERTGMPVEQVKKKIHATRSTYNQMRVKVLEAEAKGTVYTPMLSWYGQASFLDPFITLRKNRDSLAVLQTPSPAKDSDTLDEFIDTVHWKSSKRRRTNENASNSNTIRYKIATGTEELLIEGGGDEEAYQVTGEIFDFSEGDAENSGVEIVRMNYHHQGEKESQQPQESAKTKSSPLPPETETTPPPAPPVAVVEASRQQPTPTAVAMAKDEISLFCELIDTQLRALSTATAIETMCKVQSLITQARLESMLKK